MRVTRRLVIPAIAAVLVVAAGLAAAPALIRLARAPAADNSVRLDTLDLRGQVPSFSLIERSGRRVARDGLLGMIWLANFIYTECTESCPVQSLEIAHLQSEFAGARDLRFVSITVDPQHDTPEVLARYAERYGADRERWLFLTGDKRAVYCLARDGFHLGVVDQADPNPPPCDRTAQLSRTLLVWLAPTPAFATHGSRGLLMHSARLVLIDRAGRIRAYHLATDEESLARLRPNLRALLAERQGAS